MCLYWITPLFLAMCLFSPLLLSFASVSSNRISASSRGERDCPTPCDSIGPLSLRPNGRPGANKLMTPITRIIPLKLECNTLYVGTGISDGWLSGERWERDCQCRAQYRTDSGWSRKAASKDMRCLLWTPSVQSVRTVSGGLKWWKNYFRTDLSRDLSSCD